MGAAQAAGEVQEEIEKRVDLFGERSGFSEYLKHRREGGGMI